MQMIRKQFNLWRLISLVLLLALVVTACGTAATEAPEPAAVAEEPTEAPQAEPTSPPAEAASGETKVLKIGAAVSQTGKFFREGELVRRGYELWAEAVNEQGGFQVGDDTYTIEMIYYDDEGETDTAARLAEKLITEDEVDFIFGPFGSGLSLAVGAITEKYQKVMIATAGNADALFEQDHEYFFGMIAPASTLINPFVDMLNQSDEPPQTVAVVSKDDLFGQTQRGGVTGYLTEVGSPQVVFDDAYPAETADFSTLIGQIQGAEPDVIIQTGHHQDCSTFLSQLHELGYEPKAYFCSGPDMRDFYSILGEDAVYSYGYVLGWDPLVPWCDDIMGCANDYASAYETAFGEPATYQGVNAAGGGVLLIQAIQAAGTTDATAVRDALRELQVTIAAGPVEYDETGKNLAASSAIQQLLPGGETTLVWPPDRQQSDAMYPAPAQ